MFYEPKTEIGKSVVLVEVLTLLYLLGAAIMVINLLVF